VVSFDEEAEPKMTDIGLDTVFQNLSSTWETALNEKRQHDAIIDGVLGYLFFRGKDVPVYEHASLICVRKAIDDALADSSTGQEINQAKSECSFCGRAEPEVQLAAGSRGFICNSCVSRLDKVFKERQQSKS
jgi:hypothetical protein